ncbi:MAG: iron-containing alcohol dehydrogenase [Alphaproteobacteria bacterium]|nr:iron-containing alcohol dehydrogenase [Alphaproteobacteria bacterium]
MIDAFSFAGATRLAFGPGRIDALGDDVAGLAGARARVLVVSDPGVVAAGIVGRAGNALRAKGHDAELFAEVRGEPLIQSIDAAAAMARGCGAVVGLGGGSAMDVAKFAAAVAGADQPAAHYALCANPLPTARPVLVLAPTTSGTGSETTRTAVFTDQAGRKVWAWGDELRADLALLDPTLTTGLPAPVTAATGIDALVHAIEAVTVQGSNPPARAMGLEAIRLIAANLDRAVEMPGDVGARGAMQVAAALAGMAIDEAGTGIAHAMGHGLAALGRIHHGRAVGLCLRVALADNAAAAPDSHAMVARAMGLEGGPGIGDDAMLAARLPAVYDGMIRRVGVPLSLADLGLTPKDAPRLAEATLWPENKPMLARNARPIDAPALDELCRAVLA